MDRFKKILPWIIMTGAAVLLVAHVARWASLQVDATTLALLGLLLVIPLLEFVRKIRLGEFEAEIAPREVAAARAKAGTELPAAQNEEVAGPESSLLRLVSQDPQLGLAKLRIELEQAIRQIYQLKSPQAPRRPLALSQLLSEIEKSGDLPKDVAHLVRDVLPLANRAAHGEYVRTQDAEEIAILGTRLMREIRSLYKDKIATPAMSVVIQQADVDTLTSAQFRVTTIVPYTKNPEMRVYNLNQEGLYEFLEGYEEYAEFLVRIEPVGVDLPSGRHSG
jgi:hypothetical protein